MATRYASSDAHLESVAYAGTIGWMARVERRERMRRLVSRRDREGLTYAELAEVSAGAACPGRRESCGRGEQGRPEAQTEFVEIELIADPRAEGERIDVILYRGRRDGMHPLFLASASREMHAHQAHEPLQPLFHRLRLGVAQDDVALAFVGVRRSLTARGKLCFDDELAELALCGL